MGDKPLEKAVSPLTKCQILLIIRALSILIYKGNDEDSKKYQKGTASWGRCKPDASKIFLNITFELQFLKRKK